MSMIPNSQSTPAPSPNGCEPRNYARVMEKFGVAFGPAKGDEAVADACPWCGRDKFYLNVDTGQYHCKHCDQSGNITTYLTWLHGQFLARTTSEHYSELKARRGIASQTLRLHELAYDAARDQWLIPFKSSEGNIVTLVRYLWNKPKPNKYNLPELPSALYGFDRLASAPRDRPVLLCEGPFDAVALDYSIGAKRRDRYVIVASPGGFKEAWAEHFQGRKVRAFYDNDDAGRKHRAKVQKLLGESGVAEELMCLQWPEGTPDGFDLNDLIRDPLFRDDDKVKSILSWLMEHSYKSVRESRLAWVRGTDPDEAEQHEWVWKDRMRTGTFISLSGRRRTFKSTAMRYVAARFTRGEALPGCDAPGLAPSTVIYITAEDSVAKAKADLRRFGANMELVFLLGVTLKDGDYLNVLDHLDEIRQRIREHGVKLMILDGQNSLVGAPNISTDMLARHNITNKLHRFAQEERIALVGIRNEDRDGRAYGPASMSDQSRCILRTEELEVVRGTRYFELTFDVSDAAPSTHPPLPYAVEDLPGSPPVILWGASPPAVPALPVPPMLAARLAASRGGVAFSTNGDGGEAAG